MFSFLVLLSSAQFVAALENFRLELRNRYEGRELDEDASPEDEWRELNDESQTLPRNILEKCDVTVGTGSLVKRLCWQSKHDCG